MATTKLNSKGEILYRTPGGNAWTTRDPNAEAKTKAIYTPIAGENAGQRVSLKTDGTKTVAPPKGITTSDDASNRNKSANETLNGLSPTAQGKEVENPLTAMYKRLSELQTQLATAKEKEATQKLEADLATAKEKEATQKLEADLATTPSAEEVATSGQTDLTAATDAIGGRGTTENIQDPVIKALSDKTIANVGIINNQMQTLGQYREQFNEYTQQDIDSIARTAERSVQRQIEENKRTTDAMRFAGVLAGRAQFAPIPEQTIIAEVVQDGLDRIEVINEKKNTAIREARKAEAEFNIDAFEQQAELAKEHNNEIESTISAMNAQVRQVEKDEREKIEFRNTQAERNSLILAEQLLDATPEQIQQTAIANGIDIGLLSKAVNDAKFTASDRDLTTRSKEENILSSQESRANEKIRLGFEQTRLGLEQARFNREGQKDVKSDIPDDVEQGFRSVARLSKADAEASWEDIKNFGLNDSVSLWLEGGLSKSQVKAMVSAHEQSQRIKDEDGVIQPTETEKTLDSFIDSYKTSKNKKGEQDFANLVTGQFFKAN